MYKFLVILLTVSCIGCAGATIETTPETCKATYYSVFKNFQGVNMSACGGQGQADNTKNDEVIKDIKNLVETIP